jgi:predicted nuclease of predicted toxin-antitoxin system
VKILLDHCVPRPFARALPAHDVKTTAQMGWAALQNGRLLAEAARQFDVFLTVDKNIKNQQNLLTLPLPVIVLDALMNTPQALLPFAPFVEQLLPSIQFGQMILIAASGNRTELAPARPRQP